MTPKQCVRKFYPSARCDCTWPDAIGALQEWVVVSSGLILGRGFTAAQAWRSAWRALEAKEQA